MNLAEIVRKMVAGELASLRLIQATVTEVQEAAKTCTCQPYGKAKLLDVRLQAIVDGPDRGIVIIPKMNSVVQIALLDGTGAQSVILSYTEWTTIWWRNEHVDLTLKEDGEAYLANDEASLLMEAGGHTTIDAPLISLGSGGYEPLVKGNTFKGLLDDAFGELDAELTQLDSLLTQIPLITVATAMGLSGVPVNAAAFIPIKAALAAVKAQLAAIKAQFPDFLSQVSETE